MSYERQVKVIAHGYLKDFFPEPFNMTGYSVAEIINGICIQTKKLNPLPGQGRHCISIPGFDTVEKLEAPLLKGTTEIHLVPNMASGKSGFFQIVLGIVLVAVALMNPELSIPLVGSMSITSGTILSMGISMLAGGLLQMLSPQPHIDQGNFGSSNPAASKYLGATQNTVKVGTRIPLLYGKHIVYGQYLSFDIDAKDVAI